MNQYKIGVSIVICCYNSTQRLPETLTHLKAQYVPDHIPWEVIVVDNASTDGTGEAALYLWGDFPRVPFRVVQEPNPGLVNARIKGFESSQYEFVCFIDDDNWVAENWVEMVFDKMLEYPQAGAIGGRSEAVFEQEPPVWFPDFEVAFAVGEQGEKEGELTPRKTLWGAGITIRRYAYQDILEAGFNPLLTGRKGKQLSSGEDSEILLSLMLSGWKLVYSPLLKLQHFMPASRLTWKTLCLTYRGFGRANIHLKNYQKLLMPSCSGRLSRKDKWHRTIISNLFSLLTDPKRLLTALLCHDEGSHEVIRTNFEIGKLLERISIKGDIEKEEKMLELRYFER